MTRRVTRRGLLLGGAAVTLAAAGGAVWLSGRTDPAATLTAPQAHARATQGTLWLIDIRRPGEWRATGIGEGAIPLDMRRPDFVAALRAVSAAAPGLPVAVICARGVRSARLAARLSEAGFPTIYDVPEGMLGSRAGPGWVARGLPVVTPGGTAGLARAG